MSFGELTAIVGDVIEHKSHKSEVSISFLNGEGRGKVLISELTAMGDVSNPGS